jgi:hypothetical protein
VQAGADPKEAKIQEGRGASGISPVTLATALDVGRKPLKPGARELARITPQERGQ